LETVKTIDAIFSGVFTLSY